MCVFFYIFAENIFIPKDTIIIMRQYFSHTFFLLLLSSTFSCNKHISAENLELRRIISEVEFIHSSDSPNEYQIRYIDRKYGMFIHFGINTFHNEEWTDGSKPASSYNPSGIDARQWVETAKNAGMTYIVLVAKHHEGFCLWDSRYTEYDVANSGNKTNVIEEVAKECKRQGIGLGLYYSLWDRAKNANVADSTLDIKYNYYILDQLDELIDIVQQHTEFVELWLDGGWKKPNYRWPLAEIYKAVKLKSPQCQIGVNWSIGLPGNPDKHLVLPTEQKEGYPIRYFPSDFRLGDPYLPADPDPKLFTHEGKSYYMPWESTVCISEKWFFHTEDNNYKSVEELAGIYFRATAQDNVLLLNVSPNREGSIRDRDVQILFELRNHIDQ